MREHKIYIFLHVIVEVEGRKPLLKPSLRTVFFSWIKKHAREKGYRIHALGGGLEHVHFFIQLHPAQNLLQVIKWIKDESHRFIDESKFLTEPFAWASDYRAFSVSPSNYTQTMEYLLKQDDFHQHKTFEQEIELIDNIRITTDES